MNITPEEARAALVAADAGHHAVADEVGVPGWYWWGLGAAWIGFGVIADLDVFWLTIAVTLAFGIAHAQVFARVAHGRRRTGAVQVRRDVAGRRTMLHVWLLLLALAAAGVAFALLVAADGAAHPAIIGAVLPAAVVVAGGPTLVRWSTRRQAARRDG
ncbi:hypothetical protein Xcel_3272 [Xylanimonas cellulosilytica DSM 15894]|uniref:Uncharacterized protein n=1 Tax=Xylanimonas cellulosilytica (strain DSM 15894 / JCM 12276 / CECT 5975 / KCTC 9989 / LMG 20990 / NBRC 107835 / XIL07) TaxID=446471 RepID=D1BRK6_XYLCX|nr:hypothetical protein [Xylanimonas cellulosilytica]ACZ32272.1 hypothetical protein Xcel_3272 [Xylanimonas cellulosilytica DSM 15894]